MTGLADGKIAPVTAVVDDLPVEIEAPEPEPSPSKPPLLTRIGRRIIRRPSNWLNSPWPTERIVQYLTALVLVGGATFAVLQVVHLQLVFTDNTPTCCCRTVSSAAGACTGTRASPCTASTWSCRHCWSSGSTPCGSRTAWRSR